MQNKAHPVKPAKKIPSRSKFGNEQLYNAKIVSPLVEKQGKKNHSLKNEK
jgi:hypothetical protein